MVNESSVSRLIHRSLAGSVFYGEYEQAFAAATGLPLQLRAAGSWDLAQHGHANENPFCALIARSGPACAACLEVQARLEKTETTAPQTVVCPAGLCDTAMPVLAGGVTVAYLYTGQVFLEPPSAAGFALAVKQFRQWKIDLETPEYRSAFFASPVLAQAKHSAVVKLLAFFAEQLSQKAADLLLSVKAAEPAAIQSAKLWIATHHEGDCALETVAQAVHMNAFTFSRLFKQSTGLPFTKYVARTRVLAAQKQLQSPEARINEVALAVGFGSLPHFNRVFRQITGQSPTQYRQSFSGRKAGSTSARRRSSAA